MEAENSPKAKIRSDFKQVTPQLEKPTATEIILSENKHGLPENTADTNPHNIMCEAVGCYSQADTKIHLKVGSKGIIPLFLCTTCKSKLHLSESSEDQMLQDKSCT
jgi:hypothetical protein